MPSNSKQHARRQKKQESKNLAPAIKATKLDEDQVPPEVKWDAIIYIKSKAYYYWNNHDGSHMLMLKDDAPGTCTVMTLTSKDLDDLYTDKKAGVAFRRLSNKSGFVQALSKQVEANYAKQPHL